MTAAKMGSLIKSNCLISKLKKQTHWFWRVAFSYVEKPTRAILRMFQMGYILWDLESCCCYELYFEQFSILDWYELLLGSLSLGQTPLKMGKNLYWMKTSVCLETTEQEKKKTRTTYFCLFVSLKTNRGWEGGRNRFYFCMWTWEVKYFLFYALLNKAHAFFADPKESRINWDKKKKIVRIEYHSPSVLKLKIDKLGQIWLYTGKMLQLDYSPFYKESQVSTIWFCFNLSLYTYFNSFYLLLFVTHELDFYLRALEFAGIEGRWRWWVMMFVVRNSLSPSW